MEETIKNLAESLKKADKAIQDNFTTPKDERTPRKKHYTFSIHNPLKRVGSLPDIPTELAKHPKEVRATHRVVYNRKTLTFEAVEIGDQENPPPSQHQPGGSGSGDFNQPPIQVYLQEVKKKDEKIEPKDEKFDQDQPSGSGGKPPKPPHEQLLQANLQKIEDIKMANVPSKRPTSQNSTGNGKS